MFALGIGLIIYSKSMSEICTVDTLVARFEEILPLDLIWKLWRGKIKNNEME